ncbi:HlyD family secretion protein [Roseobacter sp. GAI101]|uniref:HlyD family secretion protein n=1 Tax=Roseobacter sp. (strain GAI101) TaxID=391589 RepID=UPI0001871843|nr:HlyD family secretion protein [Roseobacter sp. GAI101]EEB83103.1 multidrug resistance efflux pump [Roseobacter sp. GAI101]
MKYLKPILLVATVAAIGGGLWLRWQYESIHPSTDDAYLQANVLTIAPQVGGTVDQIAVVENQYVTAGDLLFSNKTDDLELAVQAAEARYDEAVQQAGAEITGLTSLTGQVDSARAALTDTQDTYDRTDALFKMGDVSQAALDQATTARDQAQAALDTAQAALKSGQKRAGAPGKENASVRAAQSQLTAAQINLARAQVTAPASGWIANFDLRPGAIVAAGVPQFSLVEDGDWWISANFKETDLARLRPDQPVTVSIDMYPGLTLGGTVDSLGAGSGTIFSLLPPQNASGNWVKVTQRFPVRIRLDSRPDDPALQLRAGATVSVEIDTSGLDATK